MKYIIITPAKNEEKFIKKTIESVINQTIKPFQWIIVDDGSTDDTVSIINDYMAQNAFMDLIQTKRIEKHMPGSGVMKAFHLGFDNIKIKNWDFLIKLDADISFSNNYFEEIFKKFAENNHLGIASGVIYNLINGSFQYEKTPKFHTRGASKVYRNKCFNDIGGLEKIYGWDTIDNIKAILKGWETRNFPDLRILHYRPTGRITGNLKWCVKKGEGAYYLGYHPLFLLLRSARTSCVSNPKILCGLAMLFGYFESCLRRKPQYHDMDVLSFIRKQQLNKILFKKTIWQ